MEHSPELIAEKQALVQRLERARQALLEAIGECSDEELQVVSSEGTWTVREILAHLACAEPDLLHLVRRIVAGKGGSPEDFDLDRYNARQLAKRIDRDRTTLLADLDASRQDCLVLLESLSAEDMAQMGRQPAHDVVEARRFFKIIAYHEEMHSREIQATVAVARGQ